MARPSSHQKGPRMTTTSSRSRPRPRPPAAPSSGRWRSPRSPRALLTAALLYLGFGHRSGRVHVLGSLADRAERATGMPGWVALPSAIATVSLLIALLRHVLGHLPAHRQRPRRRAAGQPGPLLDPRRPVRHLHRRLHRDGAAARAAEHGRDPPRPRLVGAARRRPDLRLRRLLPDRLPARRRLAPPLRPGRDPLGPDPPDADRRRRDDPGRDRRADRRGAARQRRPRAAATGARPRRGCCARSR